MNGNQKYKFPVAAEVAAQQRAVIDDVLRLKAENAVLRLALEEAANELFKCPQSSSVVLNQARAALMKIERT